MRLASKLFTVVVAFLIVQPAFAQDAAKVELKKAAKVELKKVTKVLIKKSAVVIPAAPIAKPVVAISAPQPAVATPASQPTVAPKPTIPAAIVTASTTTTEEMPWWKVLIRYSLELAFTLLGLLASVFVTVLMRKYGFEDYSAKINSVLIQGIGLAEEKSFQALKLNGKPLGSAEKLAVALDFIADKAKEYKLSDKGKVWWTKKVEGWLGANRESTTTTAVAATTNTVAATKDPT